MVGLGEQRHAEARHHFQQALALAIKHQLAPIALDVCVGVAQLLAQEGATEQAVELLALAEHHEASTFETKQNARHRLLELPNQLPPAMAQMAQVQGQTRELWATVAEVINVLAVEATPVSASSTAQ
jgi:hypothetical protein